MNGWMDGWYNVDAHAHTDTHTLAHTYSIKEITTPNKRNNDTTEKKKSKIDEKGMSITEFMFNGKLHTRYFVQAR